MAGNDLTIVRPSRGVSMAGNDFDLCASVSPSRGVSMAGNDNLTER